MRTVPTADRTLEEAAIAIAEVATLPDDGPTGVFSGTGVPSTGDQ